MPDEGESVEQLLNAGDAKSALVAAQEASAAMPNNPEIGEAVGRAQLASGEGQQALSTFKKLSGLQPANARLLIRQAEAQVMLKDVAGATESIRKALELRPDYVPAKRAQVLLALMDKRPGDAVTAARAIQKQAPNDPLGWQLEGDAGAFVRKGSGVLRGRGWRGRGRRVGSGRCRAPSIPPERGR